MSMETDWLRMASLQPNENQCKQKQICGGGIVEDITLRICSKSGEVGESRQPAIFKTATKGRYSGGSSNANGAKSCLSRVKSREGAASRVEFATGTKRTLLRAEAFSSDKPYTFKEM